MIIITVTYPNGTVVTRRVVASQAQTIVNAMRADGCTVVIISNPTTYIVA